MRRALATGFIVLFGMLLLIGLSGELVLAQEGSISGYVYEEDGFTPVEGAYLSVQPGEPGSEDAWPHCCTNMDGSFTIPGVYSGTYYLSTAADGLGNNPNLIDKWYTPYGGTEDPTLATPIQVVSGSTTSGITFTLKIGGSIAGYVYEEDGFTPVEGACLWVDPDEPWPEDRWSYCDTAADGSFTIPGIYSGTYYLSTSTDGLDDNPYLIDEWYTPDGGTEDSALATPIQVVTGSTTSGITFTLAPVGSVGNVTPEQGGTISLTHAVTITVSFPPNAVSQPITVSLQITTQRPVSSGFKILGHVFSIEARTTGGTLLTTFSKPFTITVHYWDVDVVGMNEAELELYSWNDDEGWWHAIPSLADMGANSISTVLDHLSTFAVLGKIETELYLPVVLRGQ